MIRHYRVAASCFEPALSQPVEERREALRKHVDALLKEQKPDLAVLPETVLVPDLDKQPDCGAEPIDGATVCMIAEQAKKHQANICIPIMEQCQGFKHNTAVYIDRNGRLAGKYNKRTPTRGELELGIHPGEENPNPVVLDGLKIGTAICYDENYPDLAWNWISKGVDLLVFPAYTFGGKLMQSWAVACGVPLISAFPWEACIYDRDGSILADGGTWTTTIHFGNHPAWIACDLDMQSRIYHLDYNQPKIPEMGKKYGRNLDVRLMVREGRFRITVQSNNLSIQQVEDEMQLMPLQTYITETRSIAARMKAGISFEYNSRL